MQSNVHKINIHKLLEPAEFLSRPRLLNPIGFIIWLFAKNRQLRDNGVHCSTYFCAEVVRGLEVLGGTLLTNRVAAEAT